MLTRLLSIGPRPERASKSPTDTPMNLIIGDVLKAVIADLNWYIDASDNGEVSSHRQARLRAEIPGRHSGLIGFLPEQSGLAFKGIDRVQLEIERAFVVLQQIGSRPAGEHEHITVFKGLFSLRAKIILKLARQRKPPPAAIKIHAKCAIE